MDLKLLSTKGSENKPFLQEATDVYRKIFMYVINFHVWLKLLYDKSQILFHNFLKMRRKHDVINGSLLHCKISF